MSVKVREGKDRLVVTGAEYAADVDLASLQLSIRNETMQFNFNLRGCVQFRKATETADPPIVDGIGHVANCAVKGSTVIIEVTTRQTALNKTILLEFMRDHFTYALGMESNETLLIYDVNYGASLDVDGSETKSQAEFEEFFIWCPDRYQSILPFNQEVELRLSSGRLPEEGFFRGDVGKYLVPPYIAALRSGDQWTGLATLEIPACQLGLNVFLTRQDYRLNFRYSYNLAFNPGEGRYFPKVGFFFSNHKDGVLRRYIDCLNENKRTIQPSSWASWWAGPMYCTYADQVYQHTIDSGIMKDEPGASANCNEKFVTERLGILDAHRIPYKIITLDYAWLGKLGDHLPHPERFPDLRAFVDGLHRQGKYVLLWFAPFFCEAESALALEHPGWMVKNPDGSLHAHTWMQKTIHMPDFTHPEVREYFAALVRTLLGSANGEFNADGFKIDGYSFLPDVGARFFDSSWGTGELFQYKADQLIYDVAKSVKADALVEQSFANPLFNDVQDVCRLNDASNYDTDLYEDRAWVALLARVAVPDTDDWSAFKKMFIHSTLRKAVYGIPTLYAIKYRGTGRMGGASGGYPVPIAKEDYSRVSAILRVYEHVPIDQSQERFVDPGNKIFWRKYTTGSLANFYAATTLAGNTAIAAFTPETIYLAAIMETQAAVPLPPGYQVKQVKEIHTDGRLIEPRHSILADFVIVWMLPSIGDVDHYEIELTCM